MMYHNPVLLRETIEGLNIKAGGTYVDVTFGGGGHSNAILQQLENGKLYAFDQDPDAMKNVIKDPRCVMIKANFRHLKRFMKFHQETQVDGLLADLGISSHQIDVPERGFSTRFEADLDMRMDKESGITAADILNTYTEQRLKQLFSEYGEIVNSGRLAATIIKARELQPFKTISDLKKAIEPCVTRGKENQYYAQLFQALRIEVNDELGALRDLLEQSTEVIGKGGRIAIISYHSLEDRLVKNYFSKGKFEGEREKDFFGNPLPVPFRPLTKKPVTPSYEELKSNPRSRSARLRIAEKN